MTFERTKDAANGQHWFAGEIPLNSGFVAIIGNKGSGKSALADVLALLGNSHSSEHFAFLRRDRFLKKSGTLGEMFRAMSSWKSGATYERLLNEKVDKNLPELVKYIPQNYLETICTELKDSQSTQFDAELMDVIFSHVSLADQLGKSSLQELIAYLTSETEERIHQIEQELSRCNVGIVELEEQCTPEHRLSLEAELEQRIAELRAHDLAKPEELQQPEQDPNVLAEAQAISSKLIELQDRADQLEGLLKDKEEEDRQATARIAAADKLTSRIANFRRQYNAFIIESTGDCELLGLDPARLVRLAVDEDSIRATRESSVIVQTTARADADSDCADSTAATLARVRTEIDQQRILLDEPNRRYQQYLFALREWQDRRDAIEGSADKAYSVRGTQARLDALKDLPTQLQSLSKTRETLCREIWDAKGSLLAKYRALYAPVQTFIDQHPVSREHGALEFTAQISVDAIEKGFLAMIHQGRVGSFLGEQEGRERLRDLVGCADFTSADGVVEFVSSIVAHLKEDRRGEHPKQVRLSDQLRQGVTASSVYDYLFSLRYLKPRFELRWHGKPLDQLSPGERGNLLLVFYLLIDKREVPLIIDQPEENLDNQTIAKMLVPALKEAKERRQIIIVTHNPNLAVVCDADQVVHTSLNKADGNRVAYTTGALESPVIAQLILDVLEGTKPAFDLRDSKYGVLDYQASPAT